MYHNWETRPHDTSSWNGWQPLPGVCLVDDADLDGAVNPGGRLEIFAIGPTNLVYHIWQTPTTLSGWSSWQQIKGGRLGRAQTVQSDDGSPIWPLGPGVPPDKNRYCTEQNPAATGGWDNWVVC